MSVIPWPGARTERVEVGVFNGGGRSGRFSFSMLDLASTLPTPLFFFLPSFFRGEGALGDSECTLFPQDHL